MSGIFVYCVVYLCTVYYICDVYGILYVRGRSASWAGLRPARLASTPKFYVKVIVERCQHPYKTIHATIYGLECALIGNNIITIQMVTMTCKYAS